MQRCSRSNTFFFVKKTHQKPQDNKNRRAKENQGWTWFCSSHCNASQTLVCNPSRELSTTGAKRNNGYPNLQCSTSNRTLFSTTTSGKKRADHVQMDLWIRAGHERIHSKQEYTITKKAARAVRALNIMYSIKIYEEMNALVIESYDIPICVERLIHDKYHTRQLKNKQNLDCIYSGDCEVKNIFAKFAC